MGKILITNDAGVSDLRAMNLVSEVIKLGRLSDDCKQYCYVTTFKDTNGDISVSARRTRTGSDTFIIFKNY